jgi:hypothetical protein
MSNLLSGISIVLFLLLIGLGYQYKNLQEELTQSQFELQIKDNNIKELDITIEKQNNAVKIIEVDVIKNRTIYKDKIKYIEKIIEVEKAQVQDLTGEADCNKTKEIINELTTRQ